MNESHMGNLSFFRVYSGDVTAGAELANADRGRPPNASASCFPSMARNASAVSPACRRHRRGRETARHPHRRQPLLAHPPAHAAGRGFPAAQHPRRARSPIKADLNKLAEGLSFLHEEDPTFVYRFDDEIGQTIISGQGEIQLQIASEELKRRFNVEVTSSSRKCPTAKPSAARRITLPPQETNRRGRTIRRSLDAHRTAAPQLPASSSPIRSSATMWIACSCHRSKKACKPPAPKVSSPAARWSM